MKLAWLRRVVSIAAVIGCLFFSGCEVKTPPSVEALKSPTPGGEVSEAGGFVCGPYSSMHNDPPLHFINWSADGTHLIFDDITSVQMLSVDGTRLRQIVDANPGYRFREGIGLYAQFSPDGQAIVYTSCEYTTGGGYLARNPRAYFKFEIVTVHVDGTGTQRRTTNRYYDHLPAWSPDGHRIAYLSPSSPHSDWGAHDLHILSVGAADAEPETLVRDLGVTAPPQWAPDGTQLAVLGLGDDVQLGDTFAAEMSVVLVALDGSTPRTVAQTVSTVSWSPDGQRLALARLHGDAVQLVTMASDGSGVQVVRRLTDRAGLAAYVDVQHSIYNAPLLHVAWSPDESHLLYSCGQQFCVVDLDGELVGRSPEEFANERGGPRRPGRRTGRGSRYARPATRRPTARWRCTPWRRTARTCGCWCAGLAIENSSSRDVPAVKDACRKG